MADACQKLRPPFVTLEGGEGSGKSTQAKMLGRRIRGLGLKVMITREPGGTSLGQQLRAMVTSGDDMDPDTELLMFMADRSHHVKSKIAPALERGEIVISDRFADSSEVYQGRARGLGFEKVRRLNQWVCNGFWPDLTIVLDIDPAKGLSRASQRQEELGLGLDRMEREQDQFHQDLRRGFLEQAEAEPGRIKVVDAARDQDLVADEIWQYVEPLIKEWKSCAS